eukprot:ANDGO_04684.mRNA.1 hypothetical protein
MTVAVAVLVPGVLAPAAVASALDSRCSIPRLLPDLILDSDFLEFVDFALNSSSAGNNDSSEYAIPSANLVQTPADSAFRGAADAVGISVCGPSGKREYCQVTDHSTWNGEEESSACSSSSSSSSGCDDDSPCFPRVPRIDEEVESHGFSSTVPPTAASNASFSSTATHMSSRSAAQDWVVGCSAVHGTTVCVQSRSSKTDFRPWTEPRGPTDFHRNVLSSRVPVTATDTDFADLEWYKTSVYSLHVSVSFPVSNLCSVATQSPLSSLAVLRCSLELTDVDGNTMHHSLLRGGRSTAGNVVSPADEHSISPASLLEYRIVQTDVNLETGYVTYEGLVGPFRILSHSTFSMGKLVPSRFRVSVFAETHVSDSASSALQFLCQTCSPTFFVKSKKPIHTAAIHKRIERGASQHELLMPAAKKKRQVEA